MRICTNCGAQFDDSELFCPKCGQEVQLVPNFETIESRMAESQRLQEEAEKKREEERLYQISLEKKRNARRKKIILMITLIAAAVLTVTISLIVIAHNRVTNSYDYQLQQAQIAYEAGDLDIAMERAKRAVSLDSNNRDARYLTAKIDFDSRRYDDAARTLEKLLDKYPDDKECYELLFSTYQETETPDKIQARLKTCKLEEILTKYADYDPEPPVIDPDEGTYNTLQKVSIKASAEGTIYYTTDGTTPTVHSTVYTSPLNLEEGRTIIRAFVQAHTGIPSPVETATFEIRLDAPPAPVITPSSGTYKKMLASAGSVSEGELERNMSLNTPKITVEVPDEFTCYVSFDKQPDKDSQIYTKPIDMKVGEHVFYAVLESNQGKLGRVSSATYVYSVVTPTPTPTPKVEYYYIPTPEVTEEPEEPEPTDIPAEPEDPANQMDPGSVDPGTVEPTEQPLPDDGTVETGSVISEF